MVSLHRLALLALTKICSQPHSSSNSSTSLSGILAGTFTFQQQVCARFNTMATSASSKPITAPFGTWKSPLESETVYQKSASITGLLVDRKTGKVFHTEVRTSRALFLVVVCAAETGGPFSLFLTGSTVRRRPISPPRYLVTRQPTRRSYENQPGTCGSVNE
jgi:hypothetical protein